jgi:hypothetical protein
MALKSKTKCPKRILQCHWVFFKQKKVVYQKKGSNTPTKSALFRGRRSTKTSGTGKIRIMVEKKFSGNREWRSRPRRRDVTSICFINICFINLNKSTIPNFSAGDFLCLFCDGKSDWYGCSRNLIHRALYELFIVVAD